MYIVKEVLFWWMLIYNMSVLIVKPIRDSLIEFLKEIDK